VQDDVTRAVRAPYRPASQGPEQADEFRARPPPHCPAGQFVQVPAPSRLYVPGKQGTAVELVEPAGQVYPPVQFPVHAGLVEPDKDPNVPAGHRVHGADPPSPYRPTPQRSREPDAHAWPAGHDHGVWHTLGSSWDDATATRGPFAASRAVEAPNLHVTPNPQSRTHQTKALGVRSQSRGPTTWLQGRGLRGREASRYVPRWLPLHPRPTAQRRPTVEGRGGGAV
jgi:hypothetical protein